MKKERIYRILTATGIDALDAGIKSLVNCEVIHTCTNREMLHNDVQQISPQIVITSDWLKGSQPIPELLQELKRQNQYTRFIYLAGPLDARDQDRIDALGRMVLSGIYDICISKNISLEVIDNLIKNPKEEAAVSFLAKSVLNRPAPASFEKDESFEKALPGAGILINGVMDNVFVFTSIKPGTGKSFLSVNTACAIAKYGKLKSNGEKPKVALIEADFQTLSIGTILNIKEDKNKNMKCAMEAVSTIFDKGNVIGDDDAIVVVNKIIKDCMSPYTGLDNLDVLTGSTLTPEEINALKLSPEYYIYLIDVIRKNYDVVIIDTNSSMFHVTTYPVLQKASKCFYIINLDINNIRNNLRYYDTLKTLGLTKKISWILNENIENSKDFKEHGILTEKLEFTADEFEENYFRLTAKIPAIQKSIFLNRLYNGTPVVLDQNIQHTKDVKIALMELASHIWPMEDAIQKERKSKKKGGFFSLFKK